MNPQPQPVQENPRPKPKRRCSQSKRTFKKVSLSKPDRQPGRSFTAFSFLFIKIYVTLIRKSRSELLEMLRHSMARKPHKMPVIPIRAKTRMDPVR